MEVHAHTHPDSYRGHRKKWTHYLWEFLMLFLAVFCGFLAENKREHLIEHHREKQYIISMIEDISIDTAKLSIAINSFKEKITGLDTIILYFPMLEKGAPLSFFRNIGHIIGYEDIVQTDRTLQQLKNSGGMRLIRSKAASDSIVFYDEKMKDLVNNEQGVLATLYNKFIDIGELLNFEIIGSAFETNQYEGVANGKADVLATHDKSVLSKYYFWIMGSNEVNRKYVEYMQQIKQEGQRLIIFLKKDYHLK